MFAIANRYQVIVTTRSSIDGREMDTTEHDVPKFEQAVKAARREVASYKLFPESFVKVSIWDTMARRGRPWRWELDRHGNPVVISHRERNEDN